MTALTTRRFLTALADPAVQRNFFESREEQDKLRQYVEGHCLLCGMAVLIRIMANKPDKFLAHFGEEYRPWLCKYLRRTV